MAEVMLWHKDCFGMNESVPGNGTARYGASSTYSQGRKLSARQSYV
jgi:hypothetical protein